MDKLVDFFDSTKDLAEGKVLDTYKIEDIYETLRNNDLAMVENIRPQEKSYKGVSMLVPRKVRAVEPEELWKIRGSKTPTVAERESNIVPAGEKEPESTGRGKKIKARRR